jgi:hypothetical protein
LRNFSPPLSSPFGKNILIFRIRKSGYMHAVPPHTEGRFAIVTDAGRDAVAASGAEDESALLRTAKACGPGAPTLASSWRKQVSANDSGKKARSLGRARYKP